MKVERKGKSLLTRNAYPGITHFEERTSKRGNYEYREWQPQRSKLGAALLKNVRIDINENDVILYLGAGHGYTASFVSDIVGRKGMIFCVDPAPRVVTDLISVCEKRSNMAPIMKDANHPETYKDLVPKQVDVIFQDVAQKNQVSIFVKNVDKYLKKNGIAFLAIKARSIDVTKKPREIFSMVKNELGKHLKIVHYAELAPFEKDHAFFVCKN